MTDDKKPLAEARERINNIDEQLIALLNERAQLSIEVGAIKHAAGSMAIYCPAREQQVLDRLHTLKSSVLKNTHIDAIWREIMAASRDLQKRQSVAFLGPEGTFSSLAARGMMGASMDYVPMTSVAEVFRAVDSGQCDSGLVPLENSIFGGVGQTLDLFLANPELRIFGECFYRVSHCLLSCESDLSKVTHVYSHPQALAQCDAWLRLNLPAAEQCPVAGTALASKTAADAGAGSGRGAIGHAGLAAKFGLNILARAIEDLPNNRTRFVLIAKDGATPRAGDAEGVSMITTVLMTVNDKPGALNRALEPLSEAGVNMKKLESRPMRSEPWKYVFFVDLECDLRAPDKAPLLDALRTQCSMFRLLGSYPAGRVVEVTELPDADA